MKATKEQIIAEANRRRAEHGDGAPPVEHFIVDVVCENWTPPEPVVDPDVLAYRKWAFGRLGRFYTSPEEVLAGKWDRTVTAQAYLAGARMAREQAKPLAQYLQDRADRDDAEADRILAKYRGEA